MTTKKVFSAVDAAPVVLYAKVDPDSEIAYPLVATTSGTLSIGISIPITVGNGKKLVTTAGTRVALATTTSIKSLTIKALSTNTGIIYVGNSTVSSSNGFQLSASDSVSLDISDLVTVNLDSSVNGEGVTYMWVN